MKLGLIEYERFGNLQIAQSCFEASINTRTVLQRRSGAICSIIVKLAEIAFKLSKFDKCEELVDSILVRIKAPNCDITSKIFSLKMKAFFCAMRGDNE